ncbi:hypothetical protein DEO72_LG11g1414 [Vigna unguiculata]|uniref:Uncharacterized protein n=1 Tax=Vigna unguiculata TaxID=3917 RepID=A0A4D6NP20_VIGUN|nr:hypothetical protein DEO72_LG11g1414 [Vigna unguiculata]
MELRELEEGNVQTLAELMLEGKEYLRKGTFANECRMGNLTALGTLAPYGSAFKPICLG